MRLDELPQSERIEDRRGRRITGQIIDRREIGDPGAFNDKTDEELMEEARNRAAALGLLPPETQH